MQIVSHEMSILMFPEIYSLEPLTDWGRYLWHTLRKHPYSNILKIVQTKTGKFPDKTYDIFHISAQNIDCGYSLEPPRRGGSNEYSQSMF